jgi:cold-inducible RNA-binding protein
LTSEGGLLQIAASDQKTNGVGVRRQIVSEPETTFSDPAGAVLPRGFLSDYRTMNPTRLFVGNLSYQTMENDLQDYFSQAGVVTSVNLMLDKMTGKSRGFAFVEFATQDEANKAIEQFHNKEFQGRALTVNIARPREERPQQQRWGNSRGGDYEHRDRR